MLLWAVMFVVCTVLDFIDVALSCLEKNCTVMDDLKCFAGTGHKRKMADPWPVSILQMHAVVPAVGW